MTSQQYQSEQRQRLENYSNSSAQLTEQLDALDWENLHSAVEQCIHTSHTASSDTTYQPAPYFTTSPENEEAEKLYAEALKEGISIIKNGQVAIFTVAGGQGSRLAHDGPKGTYLISPIQKKSLFQLFAERILGLSKKYQCSIPWFIMCSPLNHQQTVDFFEQNNYFGLVKNDIQFLIQDVMPITDFEGNLVLSSPDSLAFSPNGHGGSIQALNQSGAIQEMQRRGCHHISYHQVDNPLYNPIDPLFIGLHSLQSSDMSSRALIKSQPLEKLGNFVVNDGRTSIIEYSDFPDELAQLQDEQGRLKYRAGSPAMHLFRRDFIEKFADSTTSLPYHRAEKSVQHTEAPQASSEPNCIKFETFIFDALPLANHPLILEASRASSFSPVKNPTGTDSVESCIQDQLKLAHQWLSELQPNIHPDASIELCPISYPTKDELIGSNLPEIKDAGSYYLS